MKLKVVEIEDGKVFLEGSGNVEMQLSKRSIHLKGMNVGEGDIVEITITKIKPVQKKIAKKPVKKKAKKKK